MAYEEIELATEHVMYDPEMLPESHRDDSVDDDWDTPEPADDSRVFPVTDIHGRPRRFSRENEPKVNRSASIREGLPNSGDRTIRPRTHSHSPFSMWGSQPIQDEEPTRRRRHSIIAACVQCCKSTYSFALLIFSVVIVMAAMIQEQTTATVDGVLHPAAASTIFWFLILWLGMMEGGQGALVGLQPVDKSLYAESHPRALKNTALVHSGNNMQRFIVGRQFLVVLVVFVTNLMASAIENANVLGLPHVVNEIFVASGLSLVLTTIMLGQLTAQINAASCMLDFINNYFMLFTSYMSLGIEFSGLLHCVYMVQVFFSKLTGRKVQSNEAPRNMFWKLFFWVRVLLSLIILGFAFAVVLAALFDKKTTMWEGVPAAASIVVFFVLMCFVGMMEGMQIALFTVVNLPEEQLENHPLAQKICKLAFAGDHLQAFLIGRQICVTLCTFIIARVTTLAYSDDDDNLWGVSDGMQDFFNTGLLGAVITTIVGSLAWRILASSFPIGFLSNPLIYLTVRLCLLLEASGVCSAAWTLARVHKRIMHYQPDESYIGTPEVRATAMKDLELAEDDVVTTRGSD